ncbi:hypothetical protein [Methylocucumis oryzae]|uniref:hypothetical protein n=1 Tax=Methylocucumis oryzae TaxID=1632867 RepID=UPI000695B116|nr:hypothetical protein [Methylocucumis oryzae]
MFSYPGRYPAVVKGYDGPTRQVRVSIPGITDGGDELPVAEIEYPIGDKKNTEIEILDGDTVWVAFIGGDQRYPIITGYRNPSAGNEVDWRRFHHANIELTADNVLKLNAATIELHGDVAISGGELTHEGKNVGATHTHSGVDTGAGNTGEPN